VAEIYKATDFSTDSGENSGADGANSRQNQGVSAVPTGAPVSPRRQAHRLSGSPGGPGARYGPEGVRRKTPLARRPNRSTLWLPPLASDQGNCPCLAPSANSAT